MTRNLSVLCKVSSLAIAVAMAAGPSPAVAQSLQGTPNVASGSATISEGSGTTSVTVDTSQTVIDWTPDDNVVGPFGAINFQPSGTTATFQNNVDLVGNFAVLNRINVADPSRIVGLNGTINSLVNGQTGGSIFFYSPSGFVVGSSAVINVGSLVLSASPITVDGSGNFINGSTVTFGQAPNSSAAINTVAGSQINANGAGSYVALVAPSISHAGTIRTDTAAALVAAEAATITFSPDGLFNIQVTTGTDDPNGVHVDGGTITRNTLADFGNHRAYLVAVAKNDAVTMLIDNGGSVGFETATSAAVEDNVVVLSGGYDVNGTPNIPSGVSTVGLTIDNATMSSDTLAVVSGGATVTTTGSTTFGNNLDIFAGDDVLIEAKNGNTLSIGGALTANADVFGTGPVTTGNLIRVRISGASNMTIGGNVSLSADSFGQGAQDNGLDGGDATGGTVIVQTGSNSSLSIGGDFSISADGFGGDQFFGNGAGGDGTGGSISILAQGGNSSIDVLGDTTATAEGTGGSSGECSICQISGGNGTGGQIQLNNTIGSGNSLTFGNSDQGGDVTLDANGFGGAGDLGGGTGAGGQVQLNSGDGNAVTINSDLVMNAYANGGYGFDATGGNATGGNVFITFSGAPATIDIIGQTLLDASANGGFGSTRGGDATGGFVNVQGSSGGTLNMSTLFASAGGFGSSGNIGGNGTGGRAWMQAITGATINLDTATLFAIGQGGGGSVGAGGVGTGGYVVASADAATLNMIGNLALNAGGDGGGTSGDIAPGGNGQGGQADIFASNGGLVNLDGFVSASANGQGGSSFDLNSQAGDGTGGLVFFQASNGATLDAAGDAFLSAEGYGGFSGGDCINCGGAGGDGTGGTVTVQVFGGTDSLIGVGGNLTLTANGYGASGFGGNGGSGTGGSARIFLNQDGDIGITGNLLIRAVGEGGWQTNGLVAGNGTGGTAEIGFDASDATLTVGGIGEIDSTGNGGSTDGDGGTAGSALGGLARILASGGTGNFQSDLTLYANANGGSGLGEIGTGTGGNAQSGAARVIATGGSLTVGADLTLQSISTGGDGLTGGDAIAFIGTNPRNTATSDARIVAGDGSITVLGFTTLDVHADGGSGVDGGAGGDASAGFATVHALNRDAGDGTVTLGDLLINADALGGDGGAGISGNAGTDGGDGGSAQGGFVAVTASAGNGHLDIGNASVSASAFGGGGGDGGSGDALPAGNGGNGGLATGGFINIGTESGDPQALGTNGGTADFASINAVADATGGDGGRGGDSGATNGLGGSGGDAFGGTSVLLVRGSEVTVGDVLLDASATGGNGGVSPTDPNGDGGDATTGIIGVLATNRAGLPGQRGTLIAGDIVGTAIATGGIGGLASGASLTAGGSMIRFVNSDATIDSLSFTIDADGLATGFIPDSIAVINGDVAVLGDFSFVAGGQLSLFADNGTMSSDLLTLTASDFVYDTADGPPVFAGTYFANSAVITTGNNFLTDANLNIGSDFTLVASGSIATGIFTTAGLLDLTAQSGFVSVQRIFADTSVSLLAGTFVDTGDIDAGAGVTITAQGGSVDIGNVNAGGDVAISAETFINGDDVTTTADISVQTNNGDLGFNALLSGGTIDLVSGSSITLTGDASAAGDVSLSAATTINGLNIDAGGLVNAFAQDDIGLSNISGNLIGIVSANGGVFLGDLTSLTTIDLEASDDILFGDVQADDLDFSAGGAVTGGNIIAGTTASGDAGGAISLGNINVGILQSGGPADQGFAVGMASETSISVGNVDADEAIGFATLGDLTTGNLNAGTDVLTMVSGDTTTGSITTPGGGRVYMADAQMFLDAGGPDDFDPTLVFGATPLRSGGDITVNGPITTGTLQAAAQSITTGNINANTSVALDAASAVTTGTIDTGQLQITAGTDITTGNIFAFDSVDMDAGGSILTGNIDAGSIDLFAGGDITTGYLNTQLLLLQEGIGKQFLFPGASITLESGGDISTGDISSIDGVYANAGGSVLTGDIDAFDFVEAHAGTSLTTDDITAGSFVVLTAGTSLSAGAVSGSNINATAGSTATVRGAWSAGDVQVTSNDIDITTAGSISAGDISLVSTNATQTVVGDGVGGGGYQLSDAEYDRLHANDINVVADAGLGAAPKMLIGDLSVNGADGETFHDYEFITGDSESESALGSIRILGDAVFSNMGGSSVSFTTGTFELDAATGLLSLENSPGVLGGELFLNAAHIHVASGDILDQLAEDPQYDGYQDDLNAPAAVQRPDGVIRAASIDIEFGDAGAGELNTLYVQNTGTGDLPAGFLISGQSLFGEGSEVTPPPGSIDLVINGQIVTEGGTLTGIDVRDALVEAEGDITPFTANSTINGCLLVGPCGGPESPFPPGFTPTPGIQDEITLIDDNLLPPPEFGNEDFIDDNIETTAEGATSPIEPPVPLFDTSALGDKGDVDDPVSGSGNPALMETQQGEEAACPAEGSQPAGQCKQEKQP